MIGMRHRTRILGAALLAVLSSAIFTLNPAAAISYKVNLDTSGFSGTLAQLAFDFIDGGAPSNAVVVTGFTSDGTLGAVFTTGDVTGTLPGTVTLSDGSLFNEYLTDITLGSFLSYSLEPTGNTPESGSVPDALSLFLLDPGTGLSLIATGDPTGADSLLRVDIDGSAAGAVSVYSTLATVTSSQVPAPGTVPLAVAGLGVLLLTGMGQRRSS
jgi:hypothetical protein